MIFFVHEPGDVIADDGKGGGDKIGVGWSRLRWLSLRVSVSAAAAPDGAEDDDAVVVVGGNELNCNEFCVRNLDCLCSNFCWFNMCNKLDLFALLPLIG